MTTPIHKFVNNYKVEKGSALTHTTFGNTNASYYIPADKEDDFKELYLSALESGEELNFTEKHRDLSPVLIDLDFKQSTSERLYTYDMIEKFIGDIKRQLRHFINISDDGKELTAFVLEKPEPRPNKNGGFKDGVHIVFPYAITKPEVQYIIRNNMLEESKTTQQSANDGTFVFPSRMFHIFDKTFTNSYADIYDEAVIYRNNWFMYGSKKPEEGDAWTVSKIYNNKTEEIENEYDDKELIDILSIRNKFDACKLTYTGVEEVVAYKKLTEKPKKTEEEDEVVHHTPSDLKTIEELVKMLKVSRADNHKEWINTGMCLKNIDERLCGVWIEFSKMSAKFKEGECERLWRGFTKRADGLTEGSLRFWAKMDSPKEYKEFMRNDLWDLIKQSRNETHTDIARVVYYLFKDTYVCCFLNDKPYWYEFKNHRWVDCPNAVTLRQRISNDVVKEYCIAAAKYHTKSATTEDAAEQSQCTEIAKKLSSISLKLKNATFKANIMKECQEFFVVSKKDFYDKLDENKYLLGFDNGVYDLEAGLFREGLPSDYLTFTVGYDYVEPDEEYINKLMELMTAIFPDETVRLYILITLAYALCGNKYMEFLQFWIGTGANGKGIVGKLIKLAFGDYNYNPHVSVFTTKKKSSSAADPAMFQMKGKRIAIATEPAEGDKLQVDALKAWTGGDMIQARDLYKTCLEFTAQFLIIIQMNHKPSLSDFDLGIARRLLTIFFPNKFVTDPKLPNERLGNTGLKQELDDNIKWRQNFMHILLKVYGEHVQGDKVFETPKAVREFTDEYLSANNKVGSFLAECCEVTNNKDDIILTKTLFEVFLGSEHYNDKNHDNFKEHMEMLGYKATVHKKRDQYRDKKVFYGIKTKSNCAIVDEEEEEDAYDC